MLLHDDHCCDYAGDVLEFGYHRWHLTLSVHHPDMIAAYGNVYCRTNGCAWQTAGQISGQSPPGLLGEDACRDEVASTAESADAMESVVMGDWLPMRLVSLAERPR